MANPLELSAADLTAAFAALDAIALTASATVRLAREALQDDPDNPRWIGAQGNAMLCERKARTVAAILGRPAP